jgi:cell shape-determining protein MreC
MSRALRLALLCALVGLCYLLPAQGQSSTQTSQVSEPLWQALLPTAQTLPSSFDLFVSTMQRQVQEQIANNELLQASNLSLQDSNNSLTQENAALRQSLQLSQAAEAISENKSSLLAKDLSDSMASTIRAQNDAKALELQVGVLKVGCITFSVALGAVAVYEGGHALRWW